MPGKLFECQDCLVVVNFLCNSKGLPKFCSIVNTNFLSNVIGKLTNPKSTKNLNGTL